jgi:hypothetical protein
MTTVQEPTTTPEATEGDFDDWHAELDAARAELTAVCQRLDDFERKLITAIELVQEAMKAARQ